jgi:hypothetical protein
MSTDEMTGIQALERIAPTKVMQPRQVERREFEYLMLRSGGVDSGYG